MGELDNKFTKSLTFDKIKCEFDLLKQSKTDIVSGEIRLARGCDKVGYEQFEANVQKHADIICEKEKQELIFLVPFEKKKLRNLRLDNIS